MKKEQKSLFSAAEFREDLVKEAKGGKRKKQEEKLQLAVCDYLRAQYPNVIFTCDLASGLKLPIHLAARHKRMHSSRGLPDLFIAHPARTDLCSGLFLELKKAGTRLQNGEIPSTKHHKEQSDILHRLHDKGFAAKFVCGFEEAKKAIDDHLS